MTEFHCEHVLTETGWARDVTLQCSSDGMITHIFTDTEAGTNAIRLGTVLPGMTNLHSHAFQRGMAGLSEQRGPTQDSFWTWRNLMYRFVGAITPEDMEAIAALAYCEMLESGFTRVAEFHYLHHGPNGQAYDDPAEMAGRVCKASQTAGIAMTLLPVLYRWSGFGRAEPSVGQQRFTNSIDSYETLWSAAAAHTRRLENARIGVAPHSLRATDIEDIQALTELAGQGPIHIHIAEQTGEVEACMAFHGARPIELLLEKAPVDERWCLVHATHMTPAETEALARSRAVAGLCPLTEANLGDGIFPARDFTEAGGTFGIGSDSHIRIDLAEELRLLEYSQRLSHHQRNVLSETGQSTGRFLFSHALHGGGQASGQDRSGIRIDAAADLVELNTNAPALIGRREDAVLDTWIFSGDGRLVQSVYVSANQVVSGGQALARADVDASYRHALQALLRQVDRQ